MGPPNKAELLAELATLRSRNETFERRQRELTALLEAQQAITSSLDLEKSLQAIVRHAAVIEGEAGVWLLVLDPERQILICRAATRFTPEEMATLTPAVGQGLSGLVASTRQPLAVSDMRQNPLVARPELVIKYAQVSYLGIPVIYGDRLLGVLAFSSPQPRTYASDEVALLTTFATQAAIAIENARLHGAAVRRGEELGALLRATRTVTAGLDLQTTLEQIAAEASRIAHCQHVKLLLVDKEAQLLRIGVLHETSLPDGFPLPVGAGLSGKVAKSGEPLYIADTQNDPRSLLAAFDRRVGFRTYLGLPVKVRDEVLGVLTLNTTEPREYAPDEIALLTSFADQAAVAIENARLHGAAVRRGKELEALLRATRSVMGELDLQQILDRIVTEAAAITGCLHVKLLLVDHANAVLLVGALRGTILPEGFQVPLGVGLSGKVAATGEPLFVADPGGSPDNILAAKDRQTGVATYLGLPIKSGDGVLGVLTFNTTDPHRYSGEELAYLASFADYAAIAIEKARLFQELNESYAYLQVAQDELIRAEKLRALGQMSAGIAHDLNNTLAAILGQVELLGLRTRDPEVQETLRILEMAATDGAQVVRRLQDFARQRERSPLSPVDLAQVVGEALEITRPRWRDELQRHGRVIDIRLQLAGIPPILGYAAEVREVLTSLILNAVDAMPQGGALSFTAREAGAGQSSDRAVGQFGNGNETEFRSALPNCPVAELPSCPAAAWVELLVTDTGIGMSEAVRKRIFDPFFTTKGGRGTGMGLSVVYGIMERHGGHVVVRSTRGQGTTVSLRFQRAQERLAAEGPTRQGALVSAPRRLLVVDDDPTVRTTLASMLRAVGHLVTEAEGGAAGIGLLGRVPVDLVLTDLGMPEVTGWDVARAVKLQTPKMPVILLTGWGEQGTGESPAAGLVNYVLGKPVRLQDLLAVIEELTKPTE
jgi:GAF domain-containing protein/ActR/RegA family two-component response regulator